MQIMLLALFFAYSQSILIANYTCDCSFHTEIAECGNTVNCDWVNQKCQSKDCEDIDEGSCDLFGGCSLNDDGMCSKAQVCSSYTVKNQLDCMFKKGNCAATQLADTPDEYQCTDYNKVDCSAQTNDTCNYSFPWSTSFCWLNITDNQTCLEYSMKTCSGIEVKEPCESLGCNFNNSKCDFKQCSELSEQDCFFTLDGYWGGLILCEWDADKTQCIERKSLSDLKNGNCSKLTNGRHYWINNTCRKCPDNIVEGLLYSINLAFFFAIYFCQ